MYFHYYPQLGSGCWGGTLWEELAQVSYFGRNGLTVSLYNSFTACKPATVFYEYNKKVNNVYILQK